MNLFPRENLFLHNRGGYVTLSFIPTLGTMILGLLAGQWLRNAPSSGFILRRFLWVGGTLAAVALVLGWVGVAPIVKRIWTPGWTLFSGGLCFLLLAAFYYLVDVRQNQKWFFPLIVVGMNSIAAYVLAHTVVEFIDQSFRIHISPTYDMLWGEGYKTLISGGVILLIQWAILHWMYKKRLFIKV